jgi:hypothetical protein
MKKLLILISFLACLNIYGQKGKSYVTGWHNDGDDEMSIPADNYSFFEKGKLFYFLSNSKSDLLIDIKVEDEAVQTRILKEGMTVWINMDGKQDQKMGVRFPMGAQRQGGNRNGVNQTMLNPDGSLVTPISQANTIELIGFTGENSNRFPSENADSFNGFVKYDNAGILHYRMFMPFDKIPLRNTKEGNETMPFTIGIEYGKSAIGNNRQGPPPSSSSSGGRSSRGGSGGGSRGGGGGGGGMPQGGSPMGGQNNRDAAKPPVLFWIKNIKLSVNE